MTKTTNQAIGPGLEMNQGKKLKKQQQDVKHKSTVYVTVWHQAGGTGWFQYRQTDEKTGNRRLGEQGRYGDMKQKGTSR